MKWSYLDSMVMRLDRCELIPTNLQDLPLDNRLPIPVSVSPNARLELPLAQPNVINMCEHTIVKSTFKQRTLNPLPSSISLHPFTVRHLVVNCQVCMEPMKKGAILCLQCNLIAHSKCARQLQRSLPLEGPAHGTQQRDRPPHPSTAIYGSCSRRVRHWLA